MKKKFLLSCLLIIMAWLPSFAQIQEPVKFKTELKTISDTEAQIVFTGNIDAGWHVYSTDLPSGGPISATFNVEKIQGAELMGKLTPQGKEIENFDKVFEMKLRYFENTATFVQKFKITTDRSTVLLLGKRECRYRYSCNIGNQSRNSKPTCC